jgi:AraC family ethanolamine operon transcriptional activator
VIASIRSSQFDAFEASLRGVDGRFLPIGRSSREWCLDVLGLGGIALMEGRNGTRVVYHGACLPNAYGLFLPVDGFEHLKTNGVPMAPHSAAWLSPSSEFCVPSGEAMSWFGIAIDCGCMLEMCADRMHSNGMHSDGMRQLDWHRCGRAEGAVHARVTSLVASALRVARSEGDTLHASPAREMLRMQLLDAMHALLHSMEVCDGAIQGRPRLRRREVIDRVVGLMEARIDQPVLVKDLCAQAGVSVATLQNIFAEQFGISPYRYLTLRRLRGIHRALRVASPEETVSTICARFGVWDFGRFATQYKHAFGVPPSRTLRSVF